MKSSRSARVFTAITLGVIGFQLALVGGAPWGALTQGGRVSGTLLLGGRVLAAVSALLLLGFVAIVRVRAGLLWPRQRARIGPLIWGVVAGCALGVVANAVTPSAVERALWLPVVTTMLIASVAVARARTAPESPSTSSHRDGESVVRRHSSQD